MAPGIQGTKLDLYKRHERRDDVMREGNLKLTGLTTVVALITGGSAAASRSHP